MSDSRTSAGDPGLGGTDSALSGAAERLLRAWCDRLANDGGAGGRAGRRERALVHELAAALLYPPDAPWPASTRALEAARSLGEHAAAPDTVTLHRRFSHLRAALFIDLVERAGSGLRKQDEALVGACLDRADELVGPLAAAALDGREECAVVDPRERRDGRAERLVQRLRHDIKTPLQAASLNLELLALERAGSESDVEAIETIQASIEQVVVMLRPLDESSGEH